MNALDVFFPLSGCIVWSPQIVHGSIINMQFGEPHLLIREPVVPSPQNSRKVKLNLSRRRVFVVGQWQFCIQDAEWEISTDNYSANNNEKNIENVNQCLGELAGQILLSVYHDAEGNYMAFNFDMRGVIRVFFSENASDDADFWTLSIWNGNIISYRKDGVHIFKRENFSE
ncbi:hypothetical protein [Telmatospirillum siberiense]|uniref:hypothetical protein n=1 Tax=Telmatospirillum siberiense TaxID=382514 RepID=UPI0011AF3A01|nr:hypothetical protein [Telmatospirillum siberiense]